MASAKFLQLLGDPTAGRIWLLELQPYNPAAAQVQPLYFCDPGPAGSFATGLADTPANTIYIPAIRAGGNLTYTLSLWNAEGALGGRSSPGLGEISLHNEDGALDYLADLSFAGRSLVVKLGGLDFTYPEFGTVLNATIESLAVGEQSVSLQIRDLQHILDKRVQTQLFQGTGGTEGGLDRKDQPKPASLGIVRNVEPVAVGLTGAGLPTYILGDGALAAYDSAVHALYDRGVPLTYDAGDPPAAGKWTLRASSGALVINATPAGQVTADLKGDATGGYVQTLGGVVRRLVTRYGGLTDPQQIDTAAFSQIDTDLPGPVGLFLQGGENLLDVLDRLCSPLAVSFGFDLQGRFTLQQVKAPTGSAVLELVDNQILALDRVATPEPTWRLTLGYRRCCTVQQPTDLASIYTNSVSNPGFATGANWTPGTGWSIAGGVATASAGSASDLAQTQAGLVAQQAYYVTVDLTRSVGSVTLRIDGVDLADGDGVTAIAASGTWRRDFIAGSTTPAFAVRKDASFVGTVDNLYIVPTRLDFVQQEYRATSVEDAAIKTAWLLALEARHDTPLDALSDAQAEAARQFDLFKVKRKAFKLRAKVDPLLVALGQEVRITDRRFGLVAGWTGRVVVIEADLGAGEVGLTLWG